MIVKITAADWEIIQELKHRQDHLAFCLGVLEWEFLRARAALLDVAEEAGPDMLRFGALQWEHDQRQSFLYGKVVHGDEAQAKAGEAALRCVGVDPDSSEFTIADGVVMALCNGNWMPLER